MQSIGKDSSSEKWMDEGRFPESQKRSILCYSIQALLGGAYSSARGGVTESQDLSD